MKSLSRLSAPMFAKKCWKSQRFCVNPNQPEGERPEVGLGLMQSPLGGTRNTLHLLAEAHRDRQGEMQSCTYLYR
jgi:hypothetical protein